jgi:O-antigen/teichoic acid export membrane protein
MSNAMTLSARFMFLAALLFVDFDVRMLIQINLLCDIAVVFYIFGVNKKVIGKFQWDSKIFRDVLNFSLWQVFGFSGLYIINFGDIAVIKYFMTTADIGIYNAAYKLFSGIAGLSYVISSYYASNIASHICSKDYKQLKLFFYKERLIICGASITLNLLVMVYARQIILWLFGTRYLDAIPIFDVLMVGCIFRYLGTFYMLYCNLVAYYQFLQVSNIVQSVMNIILDIIFINWFGLIGPAIATTLAIISSFFVCFWFCEKKIKTLCVKCEPEG